jgi:hypothetical protein
MRVRRRKGQQGSSPSRSAFRPGDRWDPGNPQNRERTRELQDELRDYLIRWDPIGIADELLARDEYDCLISPLMHMLHDGASRPQVRRWLVSQIEGHFGMTADSHREGELASELVRWWQSRTGES